jgi:endogenous inhibitor of DNA gyrase (YacG/DUF329 family)
MTLNCLQEKPNKVPTAVKCPVCKKTGDWFAGKYGPFCSHRCRLIDLGKWFNEEHAISEPLRAEHLEKYAELPPGKHLDEPEAD